MIKFTGPFIIIFLTAVFLFFAATNIQGGWLYLVDAFLWSIILIAFLMPLIQMRKLKLERFHQPHYLADEEIEVILKVTNQGRIATSFLNLEEQLPIHLFRNTPPLDLVLPKGFVVALAPGESFEFKYSFTLKERGTHLFSEVLLGSFGPLGLMGVYRKYKAPSAFVLGPKPPSQDQGKAVTNHSDALVQTAQKIISQQLNISHFRDYQSGDPQRFIHWKNSARNQRLIVAKHRNDPQRKLGIWVDTLAKQDFHLFEAKVALASELIYVLLSKDTVLYGLAQDAKDMAWASTGWSQGPLRCTKAIHDWKQASYWLGLLEPDSPISVSEALKTAALSDIQTLFVLSSNPNTEQALRQEAPKYRHLYGLELNILS